MQVYWALAFLLQKLEDGQHTKAALIDEFEDDSCDDVTLDPSFQRAHQTSGQDITLISQNGSGVSLTSQQIVPHMHKAGMRMAISDDSFDRSVFTGQFSIELIAILSHQAMWQVGVELLAHCISWCSNN